MISSEFAVLDFIQQHFRSPLGDSVMTAVTALGNMGLIWIVLGVGLLAARNHRREGIFVLAALGVDFLLCNLLLKNIVARPRPCDLNPLVSLLIPKPSDYSFPSGHTAAGIAAATALYLAGARKWLWRGAFFLAAVIAFSRLYLYVHFPTDIVGGAAVGAFSAWAASLLLSKKIRKE